jgi:hypothetical protein
MSDETRRQRQVRSLTLCAVGLAGLGLLFLVAPGEAGASISPGAGGRLVGQLFGASLIGYGATTWIARTSILHGIYGRAVTAGSHVHFTVGTLALLDRGLTEGGSALFWVLTTAYVVGAGLFTWLLFGGTRDRR